MEHLNSKRFHPVLYWITTIATTAVGMMLADCRRPVSRDRRFTADHGRRVLMDQPLNSGGLALSR